MANRPNEEMKLEIERTLSAPAAAVFAAWTDPAKIKTWMAPGPLSVPRADVDLRPGGRYRIEMQDPGGDKHVAVGEYRENRRP